MGGSLAKDTQGLELIISEPLWLKGEAGLICQKLYTDKII